MTVGLLDKVAEQAREAEQSVYAFAEVAGCTIRQAWEHYELTRDERFVLPDNPATRH